MVKIHQVPHYRLLIYCIFTHYTWFKLKLYVRIINVHEYNCWYEEPIKYEKIGEGQDSRTWTMIWANLEILIKTQMKFLNGITRANYRRWLVESIFNSRYNPTKRVFFGVWWHISSFTQHFLQLCIKIY